MEKYENSLILAVDDEPANIFLLDGILDGEGYRVATASNGFEALGILKEQKPDVVLLDLMMPGMSGLDVLKKIVDEPSTRDIPVIIVSAKTDVEDVKTALDMGAVDYIKKPINEADLLARLRTSLRIKNREDDLKKMIHLKDQFVSIVSHDLRGPLSNIMLVSQVITGKKSLMESLSDDLREFLGYVYTEAARLNDYTEKLLNLAFLESGKLQLKLVSCSLKGVIDEAVAIYSGRAQEKQLTISGEADESLCAELDRTLFVQVLSNLVGNAVKFTPAGGSVSVKGFVGDNGRPCITIADTGMGIKEKDRESLFSEFTKHYSRGTEGERGTGLGLSICRKILDAHGFKISFETEEGKGTTFIIDL